MSSSSSQPTGPPSVTGATDLYTECSPLVAQLFGEIKQTFARQGMLDLEKMVNVLQSSLVHVDTRQAETLVKIASLLTKVDLVDQLQAKLDLVQTKADTAVNQLQAKVDLMQANLDQLLQFLTRSGDCTNDQIEGVENTVSDIDQRVTELERVQEEWEARGGDDGGQETPRWSCVSQASSPRPSPSPVYPPPGKIELVQVEVEDEQGQVKRVWQFMQDDLPLPGKHTNIPALLKAVQENREIMHEMSGCAGFLPHTPANEHKKGFVLLDLMCRQCTHTGQKIKMDGTLLNENKEHWWHCSRKRGGSSSSTQPPKKTKTSKALKTPKVPKHQLLYGDDKDENVLSTDCDCEDDHATAALALSSLSSSSAPSGPS